MGLHALLINPSNVELHCHLKGSAQPTTFVGLAGKHRAELPGYPQPKDLYDCDNNLDFLSYSESFQ